MTNEVLTPIARQVCEKRYFQKDENGKIIEDWPDLVSRVVNHVCKKEDDKYCQRMHALLYNTEFLPNSPCLVNAGKQTKSKGLLACFVTKSPEDCWSDPDGVGMIENIANFGHIARQGGGCFHESSYVLTSQGPRNIKEINKGDSVASFNLQDKKTEWSEVTETHAVDLLTHEICEIEFNPYNKILCSNYHPFFVIGHDKIIEKKADELVHDDYVIIGRRTFEPFSISKKHWLQGLVLADGHIDGNQKRLRISGDNLEVIEYANQCLHEEYDAPMYKIQDYTNKKGVFELCCCSPSITQAVAKDVGCHGNKTYSCKIPKNIWASDRIEQLSFLLGMIDGDGYISSKGKISIYTASQPMMLDLRRILSNLGLRNSCRLKQSSNSPNPGWDVTILDNPGNFNFVHPHKNKRANLGNRKSKVVVPRKLVEVLYEQSTGVGKRLLYSLWVQDHENVCITNHKKWCQIIETVKVSETILKTMIEYPHLGCIQVQDIKQSDLPPQTFYDLTVSPNNNYFVSMDGGFVLTHNCGVDFSLIRPEGDPVFGSTHAQACGPIEHMRMISEVMASITQSGFRGMAMMSCLRSNHPDIEKFIVCKQFNRALKSLLKEDIFNHYEQLKDDLHDQTKILLDKFISNFNISVFATDDFMNRVENDEDYDLVFNEKVYSTVKARDLFNLIVESAWQNGDPGMLFYDTINDGPYKYSGQEITATNPCAEQCLAQYGSCNLGSIDVSKFFSDSRGYVEWTRLAEAIEDAIQFLDNVLSINKFPTKDFEKWAKNNRPVGLGIMGWADLLLKMEIAYGSEESFKFAQRMGRFFQKTAHEKSVALGIERGVPKACQYDELEHRRNVTTLSIAPTGTISLLAGCSSAIEPVFSAVTYRYDNTGQYEIPHPQKSKKFFRSAADLSWEEHIEMQSSFQPYIDSAISKTVNFPNSATIKDVADAYMFAWKNKCKGITVYRDGSKSSQVLNTSKKDVVGANHAKPRPKEVPVDIFRTKADGMEWHVIVGKVDGVPYEVFAVNGKQELPDEGRVIKRKRRHYSLVDESGETTIIDNIGAEEDEIHPRIGLETRRFSLELRHQIDPKEIVAAIDKSSDVITSFSKAVGRIMKTKYMSADALVGLVDVPCFDCAKKGTEVQMISESGCWRCPVCFSSKCG